MRLLEVNIMLDLCTPIYPMYVVFVIAGLFSVVTFSLGYYVAKAEKRREE